MSVRCISQVLDASGHAGTELLMLLVLADYSDDDGNSYPSVATLARKCRMKARNANYILSALQASGELRILKNEGPKGTNRYRIMVANLRGNPLQRGAPLQSAAPLQRIAPTTAKECAKPLHPIADEPSLNRQEPSKSGRTRKPKETTLPDSFGISDGVKAWARAKGFCDLEAHLDHFTTKALAKGYTYANWDAAFKAAIRDDWAGQRKGGVRNPLHADDNLAEAA